MDQLLRRTVGFPGFFELESVRGPKYPALDDECDYSAAIVLGKQVRRLRFYFGIYQTPAEFAFECLRCQPEARRVERAKLTIGTPLFPVALQIPLNDGDPAAQPRRSLFLWDLRRPPTDQRLEFTITVRFGAESVEPRQSCSEKEFGLAIGVELYAGRLPFLVQHTSLPLETFRANLTPIVPRVLAGADPAVTIRNGFGEVSMGEIRQVSFRAESIGYFLDELRLADPALFPTRMAKATKLIAATWLSDMRRLNEIGKVTMEKWAYYDSYAGLGRIKYHMDASTHTVHVFDPFTAKWSLPEELQRLFWVGYVAGIAEGVMNTSIKSVSAEGSANSWTLRVLTA